MNDEKCKAFAFLLEEFNKIYGSGRPLALPYEELARIFLNKDYDLLKDLGRRRQVSYIAAKRAQPKKGGE